MPSLIPDEQPPIEQDNRLKDYLSRMFRLARASDNISDQLSSISSVPLKPVIGKDYYFSGAITGTQITEEGYWGYTSNGWALFSGPAFGFIVPVSISSAFGGTPIGTVSGVQSLNDGTVYQVPEATGSPGFQITCVFSNIKTITGFAIRSNYAGSATHEVTVGLWNYTTGQFDRFGKITSSATIYEYDNILIPSDTDYISGGAAQVIINHDTAGNASHNVYLDYVAIIGSSL